jgi:hypothetical protein
MKIGKVQSRDERDFVTSGPTIERQTGDKHVNFGCLNPARAVRQIDQHLAFAQVLRRRFDLAKQPPESRPVYGAASQNDQVISLILPTEQFSLKVHAYPPKQWLSILWRFFLTFNAGQLTVSNTAGFREQSHASTSHDLV